VIFLVATILDAILLRPLIITISIFSKFSYLSIIDYLSNKSEIIPTINNEIKNEENTVSITAMDLLSISKNNDDFTN
jgi:hypothetical protein